MRRILPGIAAVVAALSLVPVTACDLDVPDLNNPLLEELEERPTRANVTSACTGLLIGNRRNRAQANGYIAQLGILGREAYNFDAADPRFVGELLRGPLQPGSPFGGNFWQLPYANIRMANIIQRAVDRVPDFTPAERLAILGFSKTIEATDLLEVAVTHDTNGGVIDTDRDLDEGLGAVVGKDQMYAEIARLLDEGAADLAMGGDEFPFALSTGYAGFDEPADFAKYNRAMRARVAAYTKSYSVVLTSLVASFIKDTNAGGAPLTLADLQLGVYHAYSTGSGDQVNNLINPNLFAHPSFATDAQLNGTNRDQRLTRKTRTTAMPGSAQGLTSSLKYTIYANNAAPVPIIRNEELLLLRAEAKFFTGDQAGATADLDIVRTVSGSLVAHGATITDPMAFVTALLYERRYSLAFEGHRWIDVRRFERTTELPLDMPDHVRNIRYPIPRVECDARPGEPNCSLGSQ
jgi:hypothetical protein